MAPNTSMSKTILVAVGITLDVYWREGGKEREGGREGGREGQREGGREGGIHYESAFYVNSQCQSLS